MPEKEEKEYEKAVATYEKASKVARLLEAKIYDLNKKMTKRPSENELKKILATIEKHVKDLQKAGKVQDKAHSDMEKMLEKLKNSVS